MEQLDHVPATIMALVEAGVSVLVRCGVHSILGQEEKATDWMMNPYDVGRQRSLDEDDGGNCDDESNSYPQRRKHLSISGVINSNVEDAPSGESHGGGRKKFTRETSDHTSLGCINPACCWQRVHLFVSLAYLAFLPNLLDHLCYLSPQQGVFLLAQ